MHRSLLWMTLSLSLLAFACREGGEEGPSLVIPEVRYELSGGAGHYDYAPSFIIDKYGIIYGFLCENKNPFEIIDYVYLYKGIPTKDGYVWQPGTQIVAPSETGWDHIHICDPDVRAFKTRWKGKTYNYIMTYLGVDQWFDHNQIGLAVSEAIEGPYIKFDGNPLIPYEGRDKWGTGQSTSLVKNDSTIVVYYHNTGSKTGYSRREVILNDLDNIRLGEQEDIPHLRPNSYPALGKNHMYMVSEMKSDAYDSSVIPTWVGDLCRVARVPLDGDIFAEEDPWEVLGYVTPGLSGFPRNHNPGFLTDEKGFLPDEDILTVYFTTAVTGDDWLWSYDLYSATFDMKKHKQ